MAADCCDGGIDEVGDVGWDISDDDSGVDDDDVVVVVDPDAVVVDDDEEQLADSGST